MNPADCERRVLKSGSVAFVHKPFGDPLAFAEPTWYRGMATPYYSATHAAVRAKVRAFVDAELVPHIDEWEEAGGVPRDVCFARRTAPAFSAWAGQRSLAARSRFSGTRFTTL
jgi:hypothetical protein